MPSPRRRRRALARDLLGKPIERPGITELLGRGKTEAEQEELRADEAHDLERQQFEKMVKLKEHYGITGSVGWRPWYELSLKLALERFDGLNIVEPPPRKQGKTTARWRGTDGLVLIAEVAALKEDGRKVLKTIAVLQDLRELAPKRYGVMSLNELEARYYEALRHHQTTKPKRTKRPAS